MGSSTPRTTPQAARESQQNAIDTLNARWNFGIPRPKESGVRDEDVPQSSKLANGCFNEIRFLSFRPEDLEIAIQEFEENARQELPGWQWKKKQTPGTLPGQALTFKQLQQKEATSRKELQPKQREKLLASLTTQLKKKALEVRTREASSRITNGPVADARSSDSIRRTPSPPNGDGRDNSDVQSSKRKAHDIPEVCITSSPIKRRQPPLITPFLKAAQPESAAPSATTDPSKDPVTSFDTVVSEATQVFSQSPPDPEPQSPATSGQGTQCDSQDYFPSQFAEEVLKDVNVRRSMGESSDHASIRASGQLSLASSIGTSQTSSVFSLLQPAAEGVKSPLTAKSVRSILRKDSPFKHFNAMTVSDWRMSPKLQEDESKSVTQSGVLSWLQSAKKDECPFRFDPHPLRMELSCRFHRQYGSDRFLVVHLPSLLPGNLPRSLGLPVETFREGVASWLARDTHRILRREWKAFYLEQEKEKPKPGKLRGYKVHLFAQSGEGITKKVRVSELLQWHIPIYENADSTQLKAFQRFSLGLSKTYPTVVLESSEFARPACKVPLMNDGCARMSKSLAREVSSMLGITSVPSIFQGRIAGAKGVWMVDEDENCDIVSERGFYIEVTDDSQLKIKPHPSELPGAGATKRTFEVLDYSKRTHSADLNLDFLIILDDRGVPRSTLEQHLLKDMSPIYEDLANACEDPLLLRAWISIAEMVSRDRGIDMAGSWPVRSVEQAILLLESGFEMKTCGVLIETVRQLLQDCLSRYVDAFKIKVPLSTTVFCIPDPYSMLAPDEIHLGFSAVWEDQASGFSDVILDGLDVLVARSPAFLSNDIQRRKARWKPKLRHFRDVVVFPTTGHEPLASLLTGGDYDGDKVWVCWDQSIVVPFRNAEPPRNPPSKKDCGIETNTDKLSLVFRTPDREIGKGEVKSFLQNCFAFNLQNSFLGIVANEFRKLTYDEGSISSQHAIKLATMAGYLVDAAKAGSTLSNADWKRILQEMSPKARPTPAHKDPNANQKMAKKSNIVDYLTFYVALPEKDRLLGKFHKQWKQVTDKSPGDDDLTRLWEQTCARAASEIRNNRDGALQKLIMKLAEDIKKPRDMWTSSGNSSSPFTSPSKDSTRRPPGAPSSDERSVSYTQKAREIHNHIQTEILPLEIDHPIYKRYLSEKEEGVPSHLTHWSLLRASCIYNLHPRGLFAWRVAGLELCELKRRACATRSAGTEDQGCSTNGNVRSMLEPFYRYTKFDGKAVRKARSRMEQASAAGTGAGGIMGLDGAVDGGVGAGGEGDDDESELWSVGQGVLNEEFNAALAESQFWDDF